MNKASLFESPEHPYTLQLFDAIPSWEKRKTEADDAEFERKDESCLLKVKDLKVHYPIRKGLFKKVVGHVKAVDGVTLDVHAGDLLSMSENHRLWH